MTDTPQKRAVADIQGLSIITVGSFNPRIFNPDWLARQKLVRDEEAEKARVEVLTADISVFTVGSIGLEVTQERAHFVTNQTPDFEILRDLVLSVFKLLRHTPIKQFGINWLNHYKLPNMDAWKVMNDCLMPKLDLGSVLNGPSVLHSQTSSKREDDYKGQINLTLEPSFKFNPLPGISVNLNDHFDITEGSKEESDCDRLGRILSAEFYKSQKRSTLVGDFVMSHV